MLVEQDARLNQTRKDLIAEMVFSCTNKAKLPEGLKYLKQVAK